MEFNKIRGTLKIAGPPNEIKKISKDTARVINCLKYLRQHKGKEWINKMDIQCRTSKYFNVKQLDTILDELKEKGIIEINERNIRIINHMD